MNNSGRHRYLIVLVYTSCLSIAMGQNADLLSVPSTPAFSILNYEPAAIMRPSNPKQLSTDILNSIDSQGKLLVNLGIEVAPYWMKSRPHLTRQEYDGATGKQLFFQSLMLSMATVNDSITGDNKLGSGFRFKLSGGKVSPEFIAKQNELIERSLMISVVNAPKALIERFPTIDSLINYIVGIMNEEPLKISRPNINLFLTLSNKLREDYGDSKAELERFIHDIISELEKTSEPLQKEVVALAKKRIGFIVEMAGALSFISTSGNQFEKAGVWINASNVISRSDALNFSLRCFFSGKDSATTNLDFGLGYIKEVSNFSFSIEALGRFYSARTPDININNEPITRVEEDVTYRVAAQAAYRISEDISINLALGKNFDNPFVQRSGFFSIFGINYSIFKSPKAVIPTTL